MSSVVALEQDAALARKMPLLGEGPAAMDRVEQAFVATAITGFLVMVAAVVWMMMS